jgi:hypothetical protein
VGSIATDARQEQGGTGIRTNSGQSIIELIRSLAKKQVLLLPFLLWLATEAEPVCRCPRKILST